MHVEGKFDREWVRFKTLEMNRRMRLVVGGGQMFREAEIWGSLRDPYEKSIYQF